MHQFLVFRKMTACLSTCHSACKVCPGMNGAFAYPASVLVCACASPEHGLEASPSVPSIAGFLCEGFPWLFNHVDRRLQIKAVTSAAGHRWSVQFGCWPLNGP